MEIAVQAKNIVSMERFSQCLACLARNTTKFGMDELGLGALKDRVIVASFCRFPGKDGTSLIIVVPDKTESLMHLKYNHSGPAEPYTLFISHHGAEELIRTTQRELDAMKYQDFGACIASTMKNANYPVARQIAGLLNARMANSNIGISEGETIRISNDFSRGEMTFFTLIVSQSKA